jgi:succinate dehydrogenase / fumarate reductase cytochrome b subunit
MSYLARFWDSTIGKKFVMAITGIVGVLFVLIGGFLFFR